MGRINQLILQGLAIFILAACGGVEIRAPVVSRESAPAVPLEPEVSAPAPAPSATPATQPDEALFHALAALGIDYQWGGNTRVSGFDCSGLVAHVFKEAYGLALPRHTSEQARVGRAVAVEDLQAGDLVFFNTQRRPYSHVGIYVGDQRFVHAPKAGSVIRTENFRTAYWSKRFNGARRIELPGAPAAVTAGQP